MLLEGRRELLKVGFSPHVRSQELISQSDGIERCLDEISKGLGVALTLSEDVFDASELEELPGDLGGNQAGAPRGGDEADADGTALASELAGDGVRLADLGPPVPQPDRNHRDLRQDYRCPDRRRHFLRALDSQPHVARRIPDYHERFEPCPLPCSGLLLDGHDLHHLVGQLGKEVVHDLELLDGQ